ncbi:hypothetical protein QCA50_003161 [Cerrena zonata]|uniref:UEV-domain-containing protein n=1 Tax=Cerrena zonata TaxID=2478898 RepID=A0AAW0GLS9_9APHY
MHESLTQQWLRQNIQPYQHRDTVYAHVDSALTRYTTLRPKTDVYTYDDGRTQLLLCLHGLLPISYRGAPYNIPIALWLTREYPRLPPIAYVVPTSDMLVRAGKFVDPSGKCEIEYVLNWQRKSEGCNLNALLEAMQDYFSREPPVYAKPKQPASPQPQTQRRPDAAVITDYSERPPPLLPSGHPAPPPLTQSMSASSVRNDDRPPLPVKPGVTAISSVSAFGVPSQTSSRAQSPHVSGTPATASRSPPPLPPHPPTDAGLPQYSHSPVPLRYTQTPSSIGQVSNSPVWSPVSSLPASREVSITQRVESPPAVPAHASHLSRSSLPPSHGSTVAFPEQAIIPPQMSGHSRPPLPPPAPTWSTQPQQQQYSAVVVPPPFISPQGTGNASSSYYTPPPPPPPPAGPSTIPVSSPPLSQLSYSNPPPDLLDGDNLNSFGTTTTPVQISTPAPAPPRPPNPELLQIHAHVYQKITSELASLSQVMALDAERLRAHQKDLLAGEPAIRDEMARLEAVRDVCQNVAGRLRTVVTDGERNVADLRRRGDPEVDELVCSTTIVHNQLINLVAEDNAIEDTIYHLHRALNAGRIDLERFLRATRTLAEEQFMKRALIEKIVNGIPMGETVNWS